MTGTFSLHFTQQFFWGLLVLLCFIGWGRMVKALVYTPSSQIIPQHVDWGLMAGWGMAFTLIIGGVLNALSIVSIELLSVYVLLGALTGTITLYRNRLKLPTLSLSHIFIFGSLIAVLLTYYAMAIQFQSTSCADDDIAYIPFITRMLQTGSLMDPFSLRRIAGFGGHTFLQALIGISGNENTANLMDRGVAVLVCFGLVIGHFRTPGNNTAAPYSLSLLQGLVIIMIIALLPFPFLNSASHATGLVIFLTLFRTLDLTEKPQSPNYRTLWLIAALVAAAASLRPHFLLSAALGVTLFWLICWWQEKRHSVKYCLSLIHTGLASLIFLLPWMVTLQLSSNSPLYPLFKGNHRPEFETYSADNSSFELARFVFDIMSEPRMLLLWLPLVLVLIYKHSKTSLALSLSALITAFVITAVFNLSDIDNLHRYVAPFANAAIIGAIIAFVRACENEKTSFKKLILPTKATHIMIILIVLILAPALMTKSARIIAGHWDRPILSDEVRGVYAHMQDSVPEGAGIMAMVFHPFAWDYSRNAIANIDVPGAVSPDPGMPFFKGPDALKQYLLNLNFPYLAIGDFDKPGMCLYHRRLWEFHRDSENPMWKSIAPYYLDFMDNAETLAKSESVIFDEQGFRVIRLQ